MKKYAVVLSVSMVVEVDESENDINTVLADMDYDFNVHPETDHARILSTEILDQEVNSINDQQS